MAVPPYSLTVSAWLRWYAVAPELPLDPRTRVLEIGCGLGGLSQLLAERFPYTAVEMDPVAAATAQARVRPYGGAVVNGELSGLDPEVTADLVCAFEVIEHIEDDRAALTEWAGRLAPGGLMIITTPGYPERYGAADARVGHWRRYDPADLAGLMTAAGLVDVRVRRYGGPVSFALDAARQVLARLDQRRAPADRYAATLKSGQLLQPRSAAAAWITRLAAAPAQLLARLIPGSGAGLLALGRRPAS